MNFLAHLYLSGSNDQIKLGNFIADSVKGRNYNHYPQDIQKGISLHRFIDNYTDHSSLLSEIKTEMQKPFPKYYGPVLDIFFDHFLAKNWQDYSHIHLRAYARHFYMILIFNYRWLPARARRSLPFLISQNWLESYREINGTAMIFERMHKYRGLPWGAQPIISYLNEHYNETEKTFQRFFDELRDECRKRGE